MPTEHSGTDKRDNAAWIAHYRQKAEEVRKLAEAAKGPEAKAALMGIVDDYVAMAETLERNEPMMLPAR